MPDQPPGESETPEPPENAEPTAAEDSADAAPDGIEGVVVPEWFEWPDLPELDGSTTTETSTAPTSPANAEAAENDAAPNADEAADEAPEPEPVAEDAVPAQARASAEDDEPEPESEPATQVRALAEPAERESESADEPEPAVGGEDPEPADETPVPVAKVDPEPPAPAVADEPAAPPETPWPDPIPVPDFSPPPAPAGKPVRPPAPSEPVPVPEPPSPPVPAGKPVRPPAPSEPVPVPEPPSPPVPAAKPVPPPLAPAPVPVPAESPARPAPVRGRRRLRVPGRARTRQAVAGGVTALLVAGAVTGGILANQGDDPTSPAADDPSAATVIAPNPPPPVLAAHDDSGPMPDPGALADALRPALSDPRLAGEFRAQVIDLSSGRELYDQHADGLATPASTTKITTAAATLASLPPDHQFTTTVMSGDKPGDVVIVGGGDPTLSAAAPGEPTIYGGAARLSDLADEVRASGTQVSRVVIDTSLFTGPVLNPTWDPNDVAGGDITPITSLMVDGGRTAPDVRARSEHPAMFAGRTFATMLGLPDDAVVAGTAPPGAHQIAAVGSPPVNRLVEHMLRVSDNVIAEVLIRHVAIAAGEPASFDGGADAVRDTLRSLGIDISGERLVDGSGLSDQDKLSPELLGGVLRAAAGNGHPKLHALFAGLPVAGYDGTLANRYRTDDTRGSAGLVRAKTGTLTGVATLAGVVEDADGRMLVFAFMANKVGSTFDADLAMDKAVQVLARCGCR